MIINPYTFNASLVSRWINTTGETDSTIISALTTLEADLTTYGLTSKILALYPMVGGTATKHKFNFMNCQDTDAAYRLTFSGGWTHSSTGALPNGTNAIANTFIDTNVVLSANSGHLSYYSRTDSALFNELAMGVLNELNGGNGINLVIRRDTNLNSFRATETSAANGLVNSTSTDSKGLTTGSITASNSRKLYKNGTLLNTNSSSYTWDRDTSTYTIQLGGAVGFVTPSYFYTNKECAYASIGNGLSDTDVSNLYTAIQAFQTTLTRNV